jgi:hypothetical protein
VVQVKTEPEESAEAKPSEDPPVSTPKAETVKVEMSTDASEESEDEEEYVEPTGIVGVRIKTFAAVCNSALGSTTKHALQQLNHVNS